MRHAVAHGGRRAAGPQVRRFGHVGVGVDDCVTTHVIPLPVVSMTVADQTVINANEPAFPFPSEYIFWEPTLKRAGIRECGQCCIRGTFIRSSAPRRRGPISETFLRRDEVDRVW